jgi:hypothetical protein
MSAIRAIGGPKFTLRLGEVNPILSMIEEENEWLRREFGEAFYDSGEGFDPAPRMWNAQELARIAEAAKPLPGEVRAWMVERGLPG